MIIGTWGSNKNFWGGGRISALTNATHLKYVLKVKIGGKFEFRYFVGF